MVLMGLVLMRQILFTEDFEMRRKKSIIGIITEWIVFAVLAFMVLKCLNPFFFPKSTYVSSAWPSTSTFNGFYKMKKNSVDVIFIGSSVAVNAFNPQQIYNEYGIRSYNLGSEQQSLLLSYYWIKEAFRFQTPKVVVVDLNFLRKQHPDDPINTFESMTRKCIDPMRWSSVKVEAVHDIAARSREFDADAANVGYVEQSEMSYYLPNIRFHSRWDSGLVSEDFDYYLCNKSELKGWSTLIYYSDPERNPFEVYKYSQSDDRSEVDPTQEEYVKKIGELCRDNKAKLILVNLPGSMTAGFDNACQSLASDIGADYYNYCEQSIYDQIDVHVPKECVIGHSNFWGSVKLSRFTGKLLSVRYQISPVRDEQYEETKDFYAQVEKNANLQYITDFDEYLDSVNDPTYTVFMSICDDGTEMLTDIDMEKLSTLEIKTDLRGKYRYSWYAVKSSEGMIAEAASPDQTVTKKGHFGKNRISYSITSIGTSAGEPSSSIVINGQEFSHNTRGINIVVYDNICQAMIDSVTFDTFADRTAQRTWFVNMQKNGIDWNYNSKW